MAGCASSSESPYVSRMRLYRQYYKDLTPAQRQEFLSGRFTDPDEAEARLQAYAQTNKAEARLLGVRDRKTAELEQVWKRVETFLADAEERAEDARLRPEVLSRLAELSEALKRSEAQIRHSPYAPAEEAALLQRNAYYASRLQAAKAKISKSDNP